MIRSFVSIICGVLIGTLYIVALVARHGIGVTTDSVHYLAAARNLATTGDLTTYTGQPLVSYAPFLSFLCAIGFAAGVQPEHFAMIINLVSYIVVIWVIRVWLDEVIGEHKSAFAVAATVLSPPMLWVVSFVLSEPLFIAVTLVALRNLWQFVRTEETRYLVCSSVWSALAMLTRYIGASLVVSGILFLLVHRYSQLRTRILHAILYGFMSGLPVILWLIRNKSSAGSLFGDRESSNYPMTEILSDSFNTLLGWFLPDRVVGSPIGYVLGGIAILLLLFLMYRAALRWHQMPEAVSAKIAILALFVGSYSLLLVLSSATVKFAHLDTRYWSPIYAPLILLVTTLFYVTATSNRWFKTIRTTILALSVLWSISGLGVAARFLWLGYPNWWTGMVTNTKFKSSETISYIRREQPDGAIYSNYPEHLYYLTGVVSFWLPRKSLSAASEGVIIQLQPFVRRLCSDAEAGRKIYIVWFTQPGRTYLYSPDELRPYIDIKSQFQFSDATVLTVVPKVEVCGNLNWAQ